MVQSDNPGPLTGLHVLDLSRMVAGPFAAMALGEMGADVIKVERTGGGDDARTFGPFLENGESPYFMSYNRNKRGLALDLASSEERETLRRLILEWADVVVENFKAGTLERWGLGLEELREAKPKLVTATVRGYPEGDDRPGYDFVIQASSGLMSLTGEPDGDFMRVGIPIADIMAGQYLLSGVLAALVERAGSGHGQHVTVSLFQSQVSVLAHAGLQYMLMGYQTPRMGNGNPSAGPYGIFPTKTSPVAVCSGNDRQFLGLCRELGLDDLAGDPRFGSNAARVANRADLEERFVARLAELTQEEALELLTAAGVPSGPLRSLEEVLDDPELASTVTSSTLEGEETVMALPWRFSRTQARPRRPAPAVGEHSAAILDSTLGSGATTTRMEEI